MVALTLVSALVSALRYAPVIDDPWDRSLGSVNGAIYFGRIEQNFQRLGFWALKGAPYLYKFPTAEGVAHPDLVSLQYLRHPVLSFWLVNMAVELGGWSERTFRMVPIILSSLSGALLVLLVGRYAGRLWAIAGLVLYLVLPMSFYVGSMTSYEGMALFFMLATFVAYVKLRNSRFHLYVLSWLPVFFAGQIDWAGLFILPAIWVYELMVPSGQRRVVRGLLLGIPALASVVTFLILVAIWKDSSTGGFDQFMANAQHAVLHEARKGDFGQWLANQWTFWHRFFTLPVALIAALALPRLVWRCRSATDPLPRTALALFVPAVLHVILFRDHSFDHDFWWYYGLPYVVLATVIVLRDVATWRRLGPAGARLVPIAMLLVLAAIGIDRSLARYAEIRTTHFRDLGRDFNRFANRRDALLFVGEFGQECFYLEPWYVDFVASSPLDCYDRIRDLKRAGLLLVDRVVAVVPDRTNSEFKAENLARLREIGTVQRLEPAELAAKAPTLARAWDGHGLWVLTIE